MIDRVQRTSDDVVDSFTQLNREEEISDFRNDVPDRYYEEDGGYVLRESEEDSSARLNVSSIQDGSAHWDQLCNTRLLPVRVNL